MDAIGRWTGTPDTTNRYSNKPILGSKPPKPPKSPTDVMDGLVEWGSTRMTGRTGLSGSGDLGFVMTQTEYFFNQLRATFRPSTINLERLQRVSIKAVAGIAVYASTTTTMSRTATAFVTLFTTSTCNFTHSKQVRLRSVMGRLLAALLHLGYDYTREGAKIGRRGCGPCCGCNSRGCGCDRGCDG